MIHEGMVVRLNDGTKLGRVDAVGPSELTIRSGLIFRHRFRAPLDHVIDVRDDDNEVVLRPIELPDQDREIPEMPFGSAETDDELENKRAEAALRETLRH